MSKISKMIIGIGISVLLIAGIVLSAVLNARSLKVDESVVGAMAGNINNHGLFCEDDGRVYFSNTYDNGALYSMNPDQTDIKKVYNLSVKFINAASNRLFFYGAPIEESGVGNLIGRAGVYMMKKNGSKLSALTNDVTQNMVLCGDNIYYEHYTKKDSTTFYKINIRSKKTEELLDYMVNPACIHNGKVYYNGMYRDHYLYAYDINTNEETVVWEGNIWNPIVEGEYVYYMDVENNYRLCRYSMLENQIEILSKERTDMFNVYNGVIFYQVSSPTEPRLMRMLADGSNKEVMANGVYNDINCTSQYTYFKEFGDDIRTYYVSTFGSGSMSEFTAAKDFVLKSIRKK